jgi:hypothetical protein
VLLAALPLTAVRNGVSTSRVFSAAAGLSLLLLVAPAAACHSACQLRVKCLEVLLKALQLLAADAPGAPGAFRQATLSGQPHQAPQVTSADDVSGGSGGGGGSADESSRSLAAAVSRCLSAVSAQDPSAAHQALAAQADAVLQRVLSL